MTVYRAPKPRKSPKAKPSRLTRSGPPKRTGRPKLRNAKRKAKEFARAYGSKERVEWVKSLPSVVCGERPCVNAHVRTGGTGRKADAKWIVPMTDVEHQNYHVVGKRFFEQWAGNIDLDALATATEAAWQSHQSENPS